jgi:DNA-binding NarL/FixJ family response regulator
MGYPVHLNATIRVVVASTARLYREGLAASLASMSMFEVVGTAVHVKDSVDEIAALGADVVVIDASSAAECARLLAEPAPETRVVALSVIEVDADVIPLVEAGVVGYLTTEQSLDDLAELIAAVARDESPCSPNLAAMLVRRVAVLAAERRRPALDATGLTRREVEVLGLIGRGLSNKEIASALQIELPTVKNHVHHILDKLNVHRRSEAAALVGI